MLIKALAAKYGVAENQIALGPGSGEILTNAVRAFTSPTKPLATAWPTFENPRDTARKIGTRCAKWRSIGKPANRHRQDGRGVEGRRPGVLLQPEQPDRHGARRKPAVADFVKRVRAASPDTVILIDEAYHDYVTDPSYKTAMDIAQEHAERVRRADVLEGLRHGRPARRLRGRRRRGHQGGWRLQDALRGQPSASRRRSPRWATRRTSIGARAQHR